MLCLCVRLVLRVSGSARLVLQDEMSHNHSPVEAGAAGGASAPPRHRSGATPLQPAARVRSVVSIRHVLLLKDSAESVSLLDKAATLVDVGGPPAWETKLLANEAGMTLVLLVMNLAASKPAAVRLVGVVSEVLQSRTSGNGKATTYSLRLNKALSVQGFECAATLATEGVATSRRCTTKTLVKAALSKLGFKLCSYVKPPCVVDVDGTGVYAQSRGWVVTRKPTMCHLVSPAGVGATRFAQPRGAPAVSAGGTVVPTVVAFTAPKGGVGKTTLCATAALSIARYLPCSVLVVDCDSQRSITSLLHKRWYVAGAGGCMTPKYDACFCTCAAHALCARLIYQRKPQQQCSMPSCPSEA